MFCTNKQENKEHFKNIKFGCLLFYIQTTSLIKYNINSSDEGQTNRNMSTGQNYYINKFNNKNIIIKDQLTSSQIIA